MDFTKFYLAIIVAMMFMMRFASKKKARQEIIIRTRKKTRDIRDD